MTSGVMITAIIVAGVVLICMMGIAWLWWATAQGQLTDGGGQKARIDDIEREVNHLRIEVDRLRQHSP
jgi:nitrogen fixation-related uncharacterized protein